MTEPRSYPIRPRPDDDPRFNIGLLADVIDVLARHGYPKVTDGLDLVELQQALFRFLYDSSETGEKDSATPAPMSTPQQHTEADRLTHLRRAVRDYQGEWTTCRAQRLYDAVYGPGDWRLTARRDLVTLHKGGLLTVDDSTPGRRFYTLNTWNGGQ